MSRWCKRVLGHGAAVRQAKAIQRRRPRLKLEQLEDRRLPSAYTATTVAQLIADINAANAAGGSNTIALTAPASSPYVLTAVDNTTDGATGLPVIAANDNLTIAGNGDIIERSTAAATPAFRLLDVAAGAALALNNLTLENGLASGSGVAAQGGGILNQGTLTLNAVLVQQNTAQGSNGSSFGQPGQSGEGGAIYTSGSLLVEGITQIQNNQALGGQGANGHGTENMGRIGVNPPSPGGNGGSGLGGGLYIAGGTATMTAGSLSFNSAQGGQGGQGGPADAAEGEKAAAGGAAGSGLGAALYLAGGVVNLTNLSLGSNTAQGGQGGAGGAGSGPHYPQAHGGTGGDGCGGALYAAAGTLTLANDVVTGNSALAGAGGSGSAVGSPGLGEGGGLYLGTPAAASLDSFTVANIVNNTASSGTSDANIVGTYTLLS